MGVQEPVKGRGCPDARGEDGCLFSADARKTVSDPTLFMQPVYFHTNMLSV